MNTDSDDYKYKITKYSRQKAKELGVTIKVSANPNKKIDVFKDKKKICSIGSSKYKDYPTFLIEYGIALLIRRESSINKDITKIGLL